MDSKEAKDKFLDTYHAMLDQVKDLWHTAEEKAIPTLEENLDKVAEKASELGELTKEEAEKIGKYIQKDLEQAADYLTENGQQLENLIKNDLEFAELKFAEMFANLADKTRLELDALAERARQVGIWRTGEITNVGILYCQKCGEALHFKKPGHIPPCPKCKGTEFKKVFNQAE